MNPRPFRQMTEREKQLVERLLGPEFPGRAELVQQLHGAEVRRIDEDGSIEFSITSHVRVKDVKYRVPTEGEYEDLDGVKVHVLLHVVGDKAKELELYREDNSRVQAWPSPALVRVFAPK